MDNSSRDGRRDGVECTPLVGVPVAGEGRVVGARDARIQRHQHNIQCFGWVAFWRSYLKPMPQPGTAFTLPGNNRVAFGAPNAPRRGGNTWQPLHFSAVADAMGSVLWALPTAIS